MGVRHCLGLKWKMKMSDEEILIAYMQMKIKHKDWHAVADAAMDLRELVYAIKLNELVIMGK